MAEKIIELNIQSRIVLCCMGSSGALIAGIVCSIIPNTIVYHIKKEGENAHSSNYFSFDFEDYLIIIDDFVSSGDTLRKIKAGIKRISSSLTINCIAIGGSIGSYSSIEEINPDILICNRY